MSLGLLNSHWLPRLIHRLKPDLHVGTQSQQTMHVQDIHLPPPLISISPSPSNAHTYTTYRRHASGHAFINLCLRQASFLPPSPLHPSLTPSHIDKSHIPISYRHTKGFSKSHSKSSRPGFSIPFHVLYILQRAAGQLCSIAAARASTSSICLLSLSLLPRSVILVRQDIQGNQ